MSSKNKPQRQVDGKNSSWATRAPGDVLYYFFRMANDASHGDTAVVVSQVCRRWRAVAINSPLLWTEISMTCARSGQKHPWTLTRLKRSRNSLINFRLNAYRTMTPKELATIFVLHAYRFRRLTVLPSNYLLTMTLWDQLAVSMPSLKQFEYRISGDVHIDIKRNVPKRLARFNVPGTNRYGAIMWSLWDATTITSLTLNYIGPEDRLHINDLREIFLRCRTTLQHIELMGFAPLYEKGHVIVPINMPALETMSLGYVNNIVPFLELVSAPNLKSFTLRDIRVNPADHLHIPKLEWYIDRTHSDRVFEWLLDTQLTHFAIFGELYYDCEFEFRQFLLAMTSLKSLTIYGAAEGYYNVLFDEAISADTLVPALSDLLITYVDHARSLGPFFQRRFKAKLPPLQKLTLTNDSISLIKEEGLKGGIMAGCISLSAVTDPKLGEYTVIREGERYIV